MATRVKLSGAGGPRRSPTGSGSRAGSPACRGPRRRTASRSSARRAARRRGTAAGRSSRTGSPTRHRAGRRTSAYTPRQCFGVRVTSRTAAPTRSVRPTQVRSSSSARESRRLARGSSAEQPSGTSPAAARSIACRDTRWTGATPAPSGAVARWTGRPSGGGQRRVVGRGIAGGGDQRMAGSSLARTTRRPSPRRSTPGRRGARRPISAVGRTSRRGTAPDRSRPARPGRAAAPPPSHRETTAPPAQAAQLAVEVGARPALSAGPLDRRGQGAQGPGEPRLVGPPPAPQALLEPVDGAAMTPLELHRPQAAASFSSHDGPPLSRGTTCSVVGRRRSVNARPHQMQEPPSRSRTARSRAARSRAIALMIPARNGRRL